MPNSKVVLVTGASSGIGNSIAALLSRNGFDVFGTTRGAQPLDNSAFKMTLLDVTYDSSVQACMNEVIAKSGRIDILVNNAGYISTGALEETSFDEAKSQFETNFFGAARMVNAALPYMKRQKSGQIINISSIAASIPVPFQGYYAATKAALIAYSDQLRQELKNLNIKVSVIEPGFIKTGILSKSDPKHRDLDEYAVVKANVLSMLKKDVDGGQDPMIVANEVLKIINSKSPKLHYPVGKEKLFLTLKKLVPESIFDSQVKKHWGIE